MSNGWKVRLLAYSLYQAISHYVYAEQQRREIRISLPDGSERTGLSWETTPMDIAKTISSSLAERIVTSKVLWVLISTTTLRDVLLMKSVGGWKALGSRKTTGKVCISWTIRRQDFRRFVIKFVPRDLDKLVFKRQWGISKIISAYTVLGKAAELPYGGLLSDNLSTEDGFCYDMAINKRAVSQADFPTLDALVRSHWWKAEVRMSRGFQSESSENVWGELVQDFRALPLTSDYSTIDIKCILSKRKYRTAGLRPSTAAAPSSIWV